MYTHVSNFKLTYTLFFLPIFWSQTYVPTESNDNEDAGDESDTGSTDSSHRSANNNLSIAKLPDPMSCLALDKVGNYAKLFLHIFQHIYIFLSRILQHDMNLYANFFLLINKFLQSPFFIVILLLRKERSRQSWTVGCWVLTRRCWGGCQQPPRHSKQRKFSIFPPTVIPRASTRPTLKSTWN